MEALVEWLGITEDQVHVTNCRKDTDLTGRRFKCLIASYNFLGNIEASDRDLTFGIVIMDEAHYIKNKKVGSRHYHHIIYARVMPVEQDQYLYWHCCVVIST